MGSGFFVNGFTAIRADAAQDYGMIQATIRPSRARLPLVVVAAFALGVLSAVSAPRLGLGATPPQTIMAAQTLATSAPLARHPSGETGTCGHGAYVTGDLVGDASPADVYEVMCGGR
jgi:hypothetical protein